jgi:hypothetical protein
MVDFEEGQSRHTVNAAAMIKSGAKTTRGQALRTPAAFPCPDSSKDLSSMRASPAVAGRS